MAWCKGFSRGLLVSTALLLSACQTAQLAKEVKLIGFDENVSKGKNLGPVEGSDCVFMILGYWMGGQPTLQRALINARKGKSTGFKESFDGDSTIGGDVRYFNNVTVTHDGFNAVVYGKQCINITATGFK